MKINYRTRSTAFKSDAAAVLAQADAICQDYNRQGYRLTLRQLYYRFIATDAFPESRMDPDLGTKNTFQNYKWLQGLIVQGRENGMIDWNHIEDRGRESAGGDGGWDDPADAMDSIARQYRISHWDGQPEHVEVWVEKDALTDVIARAASPLNVSYTACKGSPSASLVHESARRLANIEMDESRSTTVLYLGDHDPTGLDIPRDIQERFWRYGSKCHVERIALNLDQVQQYDPPPNFAKETDSRYARYVEEYGTDCWELDALEPAVLVDLVTSEIEARLDRSLYDERLAQEERERRILNTISDNWDAVRDYVEDEIGIG